MARYVGDLSDPKNHEERLFAASRIDDIAERIRNREVRYLDISFDREITEAGVEGIAPIRSAWTVGIEVTRRGRHER